MSKQAVAWMVIDSLGKRAVFIDQARAEQYAAIRAGVVHPLYL